MLFFVTPAENQFPGIRRLFAETQAVVGGELIYLSDLQKVKEEDVVIFGAWSPPYAMMIRRNCKAKKKYLHWASPLLQTELAGVEISYLNTIMNFLEQEVLDGIWMIDKGIYDTYKDLGNIFYAPAPFDPNKLSDYRKGVADRADVSFFTIFHNKQKNALCQLASAKEAQKENPFTLYVNGLTPEQTAFVDLIKLKYCELHFLPQKDYFEWLSLAKVMLNVFVSEAFAYTCAESLGLSVPTIVSPVVANNFSYSTKSMKKLVVKDISNPHEIAEKIISVLELDDEEYNELMEDCHKTVLGVAERNNKKVVDCFREYIK